MMEYYSLNHYLKDVFGCKVYKLCLDADMTCPNRDGSIGVGGCIFCAESGGGDFAAERTLSIREQINEAKKRVAHKNKNGKYIAYFQAFTNTYAPVERLRALFYEAIEDKDIVALSIATRPDCLDKDVLELLDEVRQKKPVFIELGLQTIHEETARYIRRGYELSCFDEAVQNLHRIHVNVVVHIIIGLPGENREMIRQSVDYVGKSGVHGVKLQLLHVLRKTDLEKEYLAGKFQCLTSEEYVSILVDCVKTLPKTTVIHRLTGDGAKKDLIAPLWSADKKRVLNAVTAAFKQL